MFTLDLTSIFLNEELALTPFPKSDNLPANDQVCLHGNRIGSTQKRDPTKRNEQITQSVNPNLFI